MQVKDLMTTDVVTVSPDTPVTDISNLLHERDVTALPVVDEDGVVVGLITEKELFSSDLKFHIPTYIKMLTDTDFVIGDSKALPYSAQHIVRATAQDVMNQNVQFVGPDAEIGYLAGVFSQIDQGSIPVTDNTNHLLGMVSQTDLVKLLAYHNQHASVIDDSKAKRAQPIDNELPYIHKRISSRFAYISKSRADTWLSVAVILFIIGFLIGMLYVADSTIFTRLVKAFI